MSFLRSSHNIILTVMLVCSGWVSGHAANLNLRQGETFLDHISFPISGQVASQPPSETRRHSYNNDHTSVSNPATPVEQEYRTQLSDVYSEPIRLTVSVGQRCTAVKEYRIMKQADTNHLVRAFKAIAHNSTYFCRQWLLIEYSLCHSPVDNTQAPQLFHPQTFLNLLRNRRLGILGDSIAMQMYHTLSNHLIEHQTSRRYRQDYEKYWSHFNHISGLVNTYNATNSTVWFCVDPYFKLLRQPFSALNVDEQYCMERGYANHTDILVVAVGRWFKPLYTLRGDNLTYADSFKLSAQLMVDTLHATRQHLATHKPHMRVIWQLLPRAGNVDEEKYLHNITLDYHNGMLWSNLNRSTEAMWVRPFNDIITNLARRFNDSIIDIYSLSLAYARYFTPLKLPTYNDVVHFCPEGVPRASNLLLQDALSESAVQYQE